MDFEFSTGATECGDKGDSSPGKFQAGALTKVRLTSTAKEHHCSSDFISVIPKARVPCWTVFPYQKLQGGISKAKQGLQTCLGTMF